MNIYKKNKPINIIFFTKEKLITHIKKALKKHYSHINYKNYLLKYFALNDISKGPMCSKHEVLTYNEVRDLWSWFKSHPYNLQSISIEDPQILWLNAEINDVIRITSVSEITGYTIRYRIVTPTCGKVIQKLNKKEETSSPIKKEEDEETLASDVESESEVETRYDEDEKEDLSYESSSSSSSEEEEEE
jgi:DNA-directed RNA polymerase subunit H (RpoH/RPB5)